MASKGILGRKLGMTQVWDEENRVIPVTVIQAGPCHVTQLKTPERDGYAAVQIAFGETKAGRLSCPELGHLSAAGVGPSKHLVELRVDDLADYAVGQAIAADVFTKGDRVPDPEGGPAAGCPSVLELSAHGRERDRRRDHRGGVRPRPAVSQGKAP